MQYWDNLEREYETGLISARLFLSKIGTKMILY
jgi:hypothetical protein